MFASSVHSMICVHHSYSQTEMVYKKNPKFLNQIQYCEREQIPIMVVIGEEERDKNGVKIRDVQTQKEVYSRGLVDHLFDNDTIHIQLAVYRPYSVCFTCV